MSTELDQLRCVADRSMTWNFRVWGFGEAIALRGLLAAGDVLGDEQYFGFVHGVMRTWLGRGVAKSAEDHVGAGRELVALYQRTAEVQWLDAARKLAALHDSFCPGPLGARCHRADTSGWRHQIWVDCMDVDAPFLVELAQATGEATYFDQAADEILGYARTLQTDSGLLYHGFERDAGQNGCLWARGNGWALMGLVDTLTQLPREHAAYPELSDRLLRLVTALAAAQHESGLWHTVVDDSETYMESTLAAMVAYALRNAFDANLLDEANFSNMEARARYAMHAQIASDGSLNLVSDGTPVGALSTYATRPFGVFPWGQGPLLLALCQEFE